MRRIPRQSGKQNADDIPNFARGADKHRRYGEEPRDYARRLMDEEYGPGNWGKGDAPEAIKQKREYNQITKRGSRAFYNPFTGMIEEEQEG